MPLELDEYTDIGAKCRCVVRKSGPSQWWYRVEMEWQCHIAATSPQCSDPKMCNLCCRVRWYKDWWYLRKYLLVRNSELYGWQIWTISMSSMFVVYIWGLARSWYLEKGWVITTDIILWDAITYPCLRYRLLRQSPNIYMHVVHWK